MNRAGVKRPLLAWTKRRIYDYALKHRLEWVEDSTNQSSQYLRNRMRAGVMALSYSARQQLVELRARQLQLAHDIDYQAAQVGEIFGSQRYPYTMVPPPVAIELLRHRWSMLRPTAERLLLGIKTARPRTQQTIGDGLVAAYTKKAFTIDRTALTSSLSSTTVVK